MGRPQRFIRFANCVLNAAGYGYCTITAPGGTAWTVQLISVSTNAVDPYGTVQPTVAVYGDSAPNPAHYIEGTGQGNRDTSNSTYTLLGGESLTAEWTDGVPGNIATFRVTGYQTEG